MARNSWKNYASIGALAVAGGFSLSSFMNEQSDVSTFDLPPEVSVMTIQEFRDGMTMAHFSKIRGIADILLENGATFSPATEMRVRYASKIAEMKYAQYEGNDHMQMSFDMARSEGEMEARQGEWSIAALDAYAKQAMELDQRFVSVAEHGQTSLFRLNLPLHSCDRCQRTLQRIELSAFQRLDLVTQLFDFAVLCVVCSDRSLQFAKLCLKLLQII